MLAARLHGPGDIRLDEVPIPEPAPGEVLLRVRAVSICASDVRMYWDGHAGGVVPEEPISQGHEFAGDVVALGPGVVAPPVGTRVAVEPSWHCGRCDMCARGLTNICRHIMFPSFPPRQGALAEYIACPAHAVCPIPDGMTYIEGALAEPLGVALHAVRLAQPRPGDEVIVLGAGIIGVCVLQVLRVRGVSRIGVIEPIEERRRFAANCGCQSSPHEADVVFECAGEGAAVEEALALARPAGKVVVVGIPHPERISFEANVPRRKELTLIFSRRSRDALAEAVDLVATGAIDLRSIPIRQFRLEQAAEAMALTASRPGDMLRAVVIP